MLEALGISTRDEQVYLALVEACEASIPDLGTRCGLGRAQVQAALAELEVRGLVSASAGRPRRYLPAAPELALESLIRGREDALTRLRLEVAGLARVARHRRNLAAGKDVLEVVHGREAVLQRWVQVQGSARQQVRSFAKEPFLSYALDNPAELANPAEIAQLHTGVSHRAVYERSALDAPGVLEHVRRMGGAGEQAKVAPHLPIKLFIADHELAFAPLHTADASHSAVLIHASALLDALVGLFEQVWENAAPILPAAQHHDLAAGPSPGEESRLLLQFLALGYTDQAIAHRLGLSHRSVQRRVKLLLGQLDAQTRFQAGLQAARRGWL